MYRKKWKLLDNIFSIKSKWLNLYVESWLDDKDRELEYWRLEKADSLIIIPVCNDHLLFPLKEFRPGINKTTLDFPGGRVMETSSPLEMIPIILKKELDITKENILAINALNTEGYPINSSFSDQLVCFIYVELSGDCLNLNSAINSVRLDKSGIKWVLENLKCLQCRCAFYEYMQYR